jgi:transcription-repair coupling factor (superfamily II helicase)
MQQLPPHFPPQKPGEHFTIGSLQGASLSLALDAILQATDGFLLVVTPDAIQSHRLKDELPFFSQQQLPVYTFPDWETLPYDHFSPHPDITSERMAALYQLPRLQKGILFASISTLMHRLPPQNYLETHSFVVKQGQHIEPAHFKMALEKAGYRFVSQVMAHGEYAMRGSLLDVFPMGSDVPYRLDFLDQEIDSLRTFDPETQRTVDIISSIQLLPAHEFPLTEKSIAQFRQSWREHFYGNPLNCALYESVCRFEAAAGIEYYLPLFFEKTQTLFDYLPPNTLIVSLADIYGAAERFWGEINERYEQLRHDIAKPILPPDELFQPVDVIFGALKQFPQCQLQTEIVAEKPGSINFKAQRPVTFHINHTEKNPWQPVAHFLEETKKRVLFCAETAGRLEVLTSLLNAIAVSPKLYLSWHDFLKDTAPVGIVIAPLEHGFALENPDIMLITESQLFGPQVMQRRLRKHAEKTADAIVRDLTELKAGMPIVHIDHGVGRYLGLQTIKTGEYETEYLTLEYHDHAKLYVPVSCLHLISRYTGGNVDNAPLHKLGSGQWEKAKRRACEKIRDVAAELLHIYARRAMQSGFAFQPVDQHYAAFAAGFAFETTPDQQKTIDAIIDDMTSARCMDRVVCGDVGFGKTEVAMRAAFLAVQSNKQVIVLVPTTLLAEQHLHTFQDRFAKWPVRIEALSRFRTQREQTKILAETKEGKIDILIGTHKLLQPTIHFKSLGLLIVDEEHRFGVAQKERIKALRAEVDLLTLTATPIPRTLNMALASIRDLSIIATPPAKRLSVKTFVREYSNAMVREAVMRETLRGGQVYFLHNEVETIERVAAELSVLLPETRICIAHGQMRESQLERIMADFYHQRFNVLLCTTIIESGIDIPTANTIIIRRADRFGLAQLHQLRGRVGRSHHQAYAYLLTPPKDALTSDAKKRLTAIGSLEGLGSGFLLATQDLEIRGAGELLGDEQSGHIQELGFSLYMSLLEETVAALKAGKEPMLDKPLHTGTEIDFKVPALIPDDYLPDVHTRLVLYKRIANARDKSALDDLMAEMIDRFGALPMQTQNLFKITAVKLLAEPLGVKKVRVLDDKGTLEFTPDPAINMLALISLIQKKPHVYKLSGTEKLHFVVTGKSLDEKVEEVEALMGCLKL